MTDLLISGGFSLLLLLLLLSTGLWVAFALIVTATVAIFLFTSVDPGLALGFSFWGALGSFDLIALPMFVWMGEILFRSRLADDLFAGLAPLVKRLPGGLLYTNIFGAGLFASISGSSAATAATVGRITLPELARRGYDDKMAIGSLAGAATLGLLVPPSIILIVYGAATEQSIARLFVAGIVPALVLIGLFAGYVALWSFVHPGPKDSDDNKSLSFLSCVTKLAPILALFAGVIGSIYAGLASPTEAAALGVGLAMIMARAQGGFDKAAFIISLKGAVATSAMILFILAGAGFLTMAMGFTGIPEAAAGWVLATAASNTQILIGLTILFILLGLFLDGISIVVLTAAVIMPVVIHAGIDPLWFGIYLVLVVEMSQITPPVGFNLFILQNLTGKDILYIARASLPFFVLILVMVMLVSVFPQLVLYLPAQM